MNFALEDGALTARRQSSALAVSVAVHALAIFIAVSLSGSGLPQRAPSEYQQKVAGRDSKIVWYKFRRELPAVTPRDRQAEKQPLRAEVKAEQSIVSSAKNAPKRMQMVWTPAPELKPAPLLDSPNLLAVKFPDMPRAAPKPFVTPPSLVRPELAKVALDAPAPLVQTRDLRVAEMPSVKLPPKSYVAPPATRLVIPKTIAAVDAPLVTASAQLPAGAPPMPLTKLPPRPFTAPPRGGTAAASRSVSVESPPPVDAAAGERDLNVAIVGLKPLDTNAPLPSASSRAQFSAGPQPRPDGADSEGAGKGLSVPDLFVRGTRGTKSDLIAEAMAAPTSALAVRAAIRDAEPVMTVHVDPSVPERGGAAKVSGAPDPRFNGRDVYMMAIQMPNLTSYSGSWLMWYSGRTARETGLAPIAAPVPHRKVDPKYVATAVEERVEGRVQLACVIDRDGRVSAVELVRGLDDRLNQSARDALAKWVFYPATRSGVPIDVDVLVEIPFRLAPRVPDR